MNEQLNKKRVLIVDDDPLLLRMLEARLTDNGYEVVICKEAAVGLQAAIQNPPNLVILDVMMPVINGYNFCKILKTELKNTHLPVIFLTSRAKQDDVKIGYDMGADGYLTKPVDINQLLDKVKELTS